MYTPGITWKYGRKTKHFKAIPCSGARYKVMLGPVSKIGIRTTQGFKIGMQRPGISFKLDRTKNKITRNVFY